MSVEVYPVKIIGHIRTDFTSKFGVPRQSGIVDALEARIEFEKEFAQPEAFRGLEGFSHLWIIWQFSEAVRSNWSATVRPPRLGQYKSGCVCHPFAVSSQRHRAFFGKNQKD